MRGTSPAAKARSWTLASAASLATAILASSGAALAVSRGQIAFDPACRFAWGDIIQRVACGGGTATVADAWRVCQLGPVVLTVPIPPDPVKTRSK
jgi:hypothetical protein